MRFKAKPNAEKRTKDRIKENGPDFKIEVASHRPLCMNGIESILLRSNSTNWLGWLPVNQVEEIE